MFVIRDPNKPVQIGKKILENKRISNGAVGFYCRLMANQSYQDGNPSEFDVGEEEEKYLQELADHGYAKKVDGIFLINSGW